MATDPSSIRRYRATLDAATLSEAKTLVARLCTDALHKANTNSSANTYLWRDPAWSLAEVERITAEPDTSSTPHSPLWGLPVSVKDCFDLAGSPTSCGTIYYHDLHGLASEDSWLVQQLRSSGAVITGK